MGYELPPASPSGGRRGGAGYSSRARAFSANFARCAVLAAVSVLPAIQHAGQPNPPTFPDLHTVPADLTTPQTTSGRPARGCRVRQTSAGFAGDIHHTLYLPTDWEKGKSYPVIVEYAGNGPGVSKYGDVSTGRVENSNLGYGISGGKGFIWICMPFVNTEAERNETLWWGNPSATVRYCEITVKDVCEKYGGDPSRVVLCGFSRGAIACNYIGLYDDRIADIWLAFIPYSHYDGVRKWDWAGSDRASALERVKKLRGRPSFICQERSVDDIRAYIQPLGIAAPFTYVTVPFRNHSDAWVLRDTRARGALRSWLSEVLKTRPGTHSISGRVTTASGRPRVHVRIASGDSHFTYTDRDGRFVLAGLIDSRRMVVASQRGQRFIPPAATVEIRGENVTGLTFTASR